MASDPTSNDSESLPHMPVVARSSEPLDSSTSGITGTVDSTARSTKERARRRVDLTDSESALIDKTRTQIRGLVEEVHALARKDCTVDEFYEGFLTRIVTALASIGGAVWVHDPHDKSINLRFHINLKKTSIGQNAEAQKIHGQLIRRLCESGEPALVPPSTSNEDPAVGGNPTENLLVVGPLKVGGETVGLVEIFQRPGAGPATQRGYLRFVLQMCEVASEYLGSLRLRSFEEQQKMWGQLEQFVQSVHRKLDTNETAFAIANEGRRLIDCDRVSVALMHGSRCVVKTVSGLDSIERRSEQVKTLGRLATAVVKTRSPLWYDGDDSDLPPQIEKRVHDHVDKSHARMIAVVPLLDGIDEDDQPFDSGNDKAARKTTPIGAIIIEQLKGSEISSTFQNRVDVVVKHSQTALANSLDHQSIFLMPLWKTIGVGLRQFQGRRLIRTTAILSMIAATLAFLCLFPYPFSLGARGNLVPERQHEIYAQLDGTLDDIKVSNTGDTIVEQGQLLATMTSTQLELQIQDIEGRINQAVQEKRNASTGKTRVSDPAERTAYVAQYERADQTIRNLTNELNVKLRDRDLLQIRAPAAGQVVNWQVRQNLLRRPVRFGQHLMTIVPPDTQWLIELEMPERRLSHLATAMQDSGERLQVTFALLSWPGKEFEGELISVDQKLDVYSDEGNSALVRVQFANGVIPTELLRSGTRVTGKVHCGTEPIGYAMFYELIETVKSKWQFWF